MDNDLYKFFTSYHNLANSSLEGLYSTTKRVSDSGLSNKVDSLENKTEFLNLVDSTRSHFSGEFHGKSNEDTWRNHTHNFFCQSDYYMKFARGEIINTDLAFQQYCSSFRKKTTTVRYLAPLELVTFDGTANAMELERFKIQKFSERELSSLLNNHINRVFYTYASFNDDDINLLSRYWYIFCEAEESVEKIGHIYLPRSRISDLIFTGRANRWYTGFPKSIELALHSLCLFDWSGIDSRTLALGHWSTKKNWASLRLFNIPFIIKNDNNLLSDPEVKSDISKLATEPLFDNDTGDELCEVPEIWTDLSKKDTYEFKNFVQETEHILNQINIKENDWEFMNIALGYFIKSFFTEPSLDQMLWYISSFEALVGEGGVGVTRRLSQRIGSILNKDIGIKVEEFQRRFENIYNLRNSLVHGAKFKKETYINDLIDAYLIARRIICWFIRMLFDIQVLVNTRGVVKREIPCREEILAVLDMDDISKRRMSHLL